jgi:hypothetical protein
MTTMQPSAPNAPATQTPSQMLKSGDGKMRVDYPNMSVITNPAAGHALLLDHAKQEVKMVPLQMHSPPEMPAAPHIPPFPPVPGATHMPAVSVKDLGKAMIEGHPVSGKQFTMHMPGLPPPPAAPQAPGMPKTPGAPQLPGMPKAPAMPQLPGMAKPPAPPAPPKPPTPTVAEVWTSQATGLPVLSKTTGEFGQQTTYCKVAPVPEPHPSMFQPPPNYKFVK